MLDSIAYQYLNLSEGEAPLAYIGLMLVGAVFAGALARPKTGINRIHYFAAAAAIILCANSLSIFNLSLFDAVLNGYATAIVTLELATAFIAGYLICYVAQERSNDAFGKRRYAFLTFLPFLNFILLFTPSKETSSLVRLPPIPLFKGAFGVAAGVVMNLIALAIPVGVGAAINQQMLNNPVKAEHAGTKLLVKGKGLEEALKTMAARTAIPQEIDEATTLIRVESENTTLVYIYEMKAGISELSEEIRSNIFENVCAYEPMTPVLKAGGTLEYQYFSYDQTRLATIVANSQNC